MLFPKAIAATVAVARPAVFSSAAQCHYLLIKYGLIILALADLIIIEYSLRRYRFKFGSASCCLLLTIMRG